VGQTLERSALIALAAWNRGDEAQALYALDQWRTFPGPHVWENGALEADMARWMTAIRHHETTLPDPVSRSWTLMRGTGWSINPATVDLLQAHPALPVRGTVQELAHLATLWPRLTLAVEPAIAMQPGQPIPAVSVGVGPPGPWGTLWYAVQPAPRAGFPLTL